MSSRRGRKWHGLFSRDKMTPAVGVSESAATAAVLSSKRLIRCQVLQQRTGLIPTPPSGSQSACRFRRRPEPGTRASPVRRQRSSPINRSDRRCASPALGRGPPLTRWLEGSCRRHALGQSATSRRVADYFALIPRCSGHRDASRRAAPPSRQPLTGLRRCAKPRDARAIRRHYVFGNLGRGLCLTGAAFRAVAASLAGWTIHSANSGTRKHRHSPVSCGFAFVSRALPGNKLSAKANRARDARAEQRTDPHSPRSPTHKAGENRAGQAFGQRVIGEIVARRAGAARGPPARLSFQRRGLPSPAAVSPRGILCRIAAMALTM